METKRTADKINSVDMEIYNLYHNPDTRNEAWEKAIEIAGKHISYHIRQYYPCAKQMGYYDDLVQDCYMAIFNSLATYDYHASTYVTWAAKYIRNVMYDKGYTYSNGISRYKQDSTGYKIVHLDTPIISDASEDNNTYITLVVDPKADVEEEIERRIEKEELFATMREKLTAREINALAEYYGIEIEDIEDLQYKTATVKTKARLRAKAKLRKAMGVEVDSEKPHQKGDFLNRTGVKAYDKQNRPMIVVDYRTSRDVDIAIKDGDTYYICKGVAFCKMAERRDLIRPYAGRRVEEISPDTVIGDKRVRDFFL